MKLFLLFGFVLVGVLGIWLWGWKVFCFEKRNYLVLDFVIWLK